MEIKIGDIVEKYRIEAMLGEGGMAIVYKVLHTTLNTHCALKVLKVAHPSVRDRMIREAQYQAQLRHPNIVTVTDVLDVNGSPGLIMEYIDGATLSHWIKKQSPSVSQCEMVFLQILDALEEAHSKSIIHRDLKPSNIIVQEKRGRIIPKVCDFGLAKIIEEDDQNHTRTGIAMGTPSYMAPEQVRNAKNVDRRADIFSLGALLYEMITQRRAFFGADTLELLNAVAMHPHVSPDKYVENLPKRLVSAINGALTKSASQRIPNCTVFREVLTGQTDWVVAKTDFSMVPQSIPNLDHNDVVENLATIDAHKITSDATISFEAPNKQNEMKTLPPQSRSVMGMQSEIQPSPIQQPSFVPQAPQTNHEEKRPLSPSEAPTLFPNDIEANPPIIRFENGDNYNTAAITDPPSLIQIEKKPQLKQTNNSAFVAALKGVGLGLIVVGISFVIWKNISPKDADRKTSKPLKTEVAVNTEQPTGKTEKTVVKESPPSTPKQEQSTLADNKKNPQIDKKIKPKSKPASSKESKPPSQKEKSASRVKAKSPSRLEATKPPVPKPILVSFSYMGATKLRLKSPKTNKSYTREAPPGEYIIMAKFGQGPYIDSGSVTLKQGKSKRIKCFPDFSTCNE